MSQDPKSRLLAKGRKIERDVQRFASFGYVTSIDAYESDYSKLVRATDGLYDSARREGIHDDPELMAARENLRKLRLWASERGHEARQQYHQGRAAALGGDRRKVPAGMQGYVDELAIGEAKRRARKGR
jgi:hypothetical protein